MAVDTVASSSSGEKGKRNNVPTIETEVPASPMAKDDTELAASGSTGAGGTDDEVSTEKPSTVARDGEGANRANDETDGPPEVELRSESRTTVEDSTDARGSLAKIAQELPPKAEYLKKALVWMMGLKPKSGKDVAWLTLEDEWLEALRLWAAFEKELDYPPGQVSVHFL